MYKMKTKSVHFGTHVTVKYLQLIIFHSLSVNYLPVTVRGLDEACVAVGICDIGTAVLAVASGRHMCTSRLRRLNIGSNCHKCNSLQHLRCSYHVGCLRWWHGNRRRLKNAWSQRWQWRRQWQIQLLVWLFVLFLWHWLATRLAFFIRCRVSKSHNWSVNANKHNCVLSNAGLSIAL